MPGILFLVDSKSIIISFAKVGDKCKLPRVDCQIPKVDAYIGIPS
jgi:hypothetical protein